jgi:hypothetical protein
LGKLLISNGYRDDSEFLGFSRAACPAHGEPQIANEPTLAEIRQRMPIRSQVEARLPAGARKS